MNFFAVNTPAGESSFRAIKVEPSNVARLPARMVVHGMVDPFLQVPLRDLRAARVPPPGSFFHNARIINVLVPVIVNPLRSVSQSSVNAHKESIKKWDRAAKTKKYTFRNGGKVPKIAQKDEIPVFFTKLLNRGSVRDIVRATPKQASVFMMEALYV